MKISIDLGFYKGTGNLSKKKRLIVDVSALLLGIITIILAYIAEDMAIFILPLMILWFVIDIIHILLYKPKQ